MAYIIAEPCIGTKDTACVDACPVDCIHPKKDTQYEDGRPGEVFMKVSKQGSTLAGIMDAFAISVSLGLQHGVPLATYVKKYTNMRFEPAGMTDDPELRIAQSLVDYIFRRLAVDYMSLAERAEQIRNWAVRPEEDNMLKVSGDGRRAAPMLRFRRR